MLYKNRASHFIIIFLVCVFSFFFPTSATEVVMFSTGLAYSGPRAQYKINYSTTKIFIPI